MAQSANGKDTDQAPSQNPVGSPILTQSLAEIKVVATDLSKRIGELYEASLGPANFTSPADLEQENKRLMSRLEGLKEMLRVARLERDAAQQRNALLVNAMGVANVAL